MKLHTLASRPQLVEFTIDDEKIVQKYGEPIIFWSWDRQNLDTFMKLAAATETNAANVIDIVKDLILDETGKPVLVDGNMLPTDILMAAISILTQKLGN